MAERDIPVPSQGEPEREEFQKGPEYQKYLKACRKQVDELLHSRGIRNVNEISDLREAEEIREKIREILRSNKPKLMKNEKLAAQAGRPTRFETVTQWFQRKYPGTYFRMCNRNDVIQSDWKSKGMRTVVISEDDVKANCPFGKVGETITDGDLVLMSCPYQVYVENVRMPAMEKAEYRKKSLENAQESFAEAGRQAGVETFGTIKSVVTDEA